jgi:hypothetical protein
MLFIRTSHKETTVWWNNYIVSASRFNATGLPTIAAAIQNLSKGKKDTKIKENRTLEIINHYE